MGEKIRDTQEQLKNPKISPMRRRDLEKYLRRLMKEKRYKK